MKLRLLAQERETLRVSLHQAVFDSIVHHLDEMSRSHRADVRPTPTAGWSETLEHRPKPIDGLLGTADHQAIPFAQAPNAAARSCINKVNALRLKSRSSANG